MKNFNYKKFLLGPFGAGILLIIIQFMVGIETKGSIPYLIGANLVLTAGLVSIIDSMIALKKGKYNLK